MTRGLAWLLVMAGTMLWAEFAAAQGRKPKLPAGFDPGGVAIAILSTGIDYRAADIAQRLARDGEGDLIGWDLVDRDNRPFNAVAAETPAALGGDANALIRAIGQPGRRVVPVRIDARDPVSLARAASFVAQTPARIVVVPMWTASADQWATFGMAIKALPDLLFIVAAGDEGRDIDREPVWPAAFGHGNLLVVSAAPAEGPAQAAAGPEHWAQDRRGHRRWRREQPHGGRAGRRRPGRLLAAPAPASQGRGAEGCGAGRGGQATARLQHARHRAVRSKRPARAENPVIAGRCIRGPGCAVEPVRVCPPCSGQAWLAPT